MKAMCYLAAIPAVLATVQTVQGIEANRAQASAERQRTVLANEEAQQRADAIRVRSRAQLGTARVALARSGVSPEGSPADVLASRAAGDELAAETARWRGVLVGRSGAGGSSVLPAAARAISQFANLLS
jgi:hypothetical protein